MHIIEPSRRKQPVRHHSIRLLGIVLLIGVVAAGVINYSRPLPTPTATIRIRLPKPASFATLAWPTYGQAAVAASGYGILATHGTMTPLATASITKVITALCVLQKQPLSLGQSGPTYTIGPSDVALYKKYLAEDGSLLPVAQGQQFTEYQALEALMLPSADNIADSLANWVFGSHAAYARYATQFLTQHGMTQTHIGPDASGFDSGTTSTAYDLAKLGELALKTPVLLQIADKSTATLPGVGIVHNYDTVLGVHGITGLKTGNNAVDTGAFLFTATTKVGKQVIPLTGVVMDAPSLETALQNSTTLAVSLEHGFEQVTVVRANQVVGTMHDAWGSSVPVATRGTLRVVRWKSEHIREKHQIHAGIYTGTIGRLEVSAGSTQTTTSLVLTKPLPGPSLWWRLTRH